MMTELANKIRRIPPKNTDCMLIWVRNIRYQGRSILGARTGGTPPAKPGSPRVNFPTVMGSIVSVVWARRLGGTPVHASYSLPARTSRARRLERETPHHGRRHQLPFGTLSSPRASFAYLTALAPPAGASSSRRGCDFARRACVRRVADATTSVASHARTPSARRALD